MSAFALPLLLKLVVTAAGGAGLYGLNRKRAYYNNARDVGLDRGSGRYNALGAATCGLMLLVPCGLIAMWIVC